MPATLTLTPQDCAPMSRAEFTGCCELLRIDHAALARVVRRAVRTIRGYEGGRSEVPPELAALLRMAVRGDLKFERDKP